MTVQGASGLTEEEVAAMTSRSSDQLLTRREGEAIEELRQRVERLVGEIKKRYVAKSLVWDENGEHAFTTIPGRHRIWLEAPEREPIEVAVEMPDEGGEQLAIVEWPAR